LIHSTSLDTIGKYTFPIEPPSQDKAHNILRCEDLNAAWNGLLETAMKDLLPDDLKMETYQSIDDNPDETAADVPAPRQKDANSWVSRYNLLRKMIREKAKPIDFFGPPLFSDGYPAAIEKIKGRRNQLWLICHPDKDSITKRPAESAAIYALIRKAYELIDLNFGVGTQESHRDACTRFLEPGDTFTMNAADQPRLTRYNQIKKTLNDNASLITDTISADDLKLLNPETIKPLVSKKYHPEVHFLYNIAKFYFLCKAIDPSQQHRLNEYNRIREVIGTETFLLKDLYGASDQGNCMINYLTPSSLNR